MFRQGEVIIIKEKKIVYVSMNRTRYVAVDYNDHTKSYTAKGGDSTGEFRQDIVDTFLAHKAVKDADSATKQAESFKYKQLRVGQAVIMKNGLSYVLRHKKTKFLSMDASGQIWDSHYVAIQSVAQGSIYSQDDHWLGEMFSRELS